MLVIPESRTRRINVTVYATIDLTAVGKRRGKIKGGIEVHVGSFASQLYLDNDQKESYLASRNVR